MVVVGTVAVVVVVTMVMVTIVLVTVMAIPAMVTVFSSNICVAYLGQRSRQSTGILESTGPKFISSSQLF
jgi:hypothetical protein